MAWKSATGQYRPENKFAMQVCDYLRLTPTGGSDAHSELGIGCYATQFDDPIRTEADVIAALKQRRLPGNGVAAYGDGLLLRTQHPGREISTHRGMALMSRTDAPETSTALAVPAVEAHTLQQAPYYLPLADEVECFSPPTPPGSRCCSRGQPGGKTRFGIHGLCALPPAGIPPMSGWP